MSPSENGSLLFWTSQHKEGCLLWKDIAPISLFVLQPWETEVICSVLLPLETEVHMVHMVDSCP